VSNKKIVFRRVFATKIGQQLDVGLVGGPVITGEVIEVYPDMVTIKVVFTTSPVQFLYTIAFDAVAYIRHRVER